MNSEQRARELLAEELRGLGLHEDAYPVAVGAELVGVLDAALRVIARTLEQLDRREPMGWVFQHEETGLTMFLVNDGINTPEAFQKLNPRHHLCGAAYNGVPL